MKRLVKGEFRALGALSIVVGALLLLEEVGVLPGVHKLWPIFPAFVGGGLLLLFVQRGARELLILGIGSYLLAASAVFLVCNYSSWLPMARAWPVFIALLGAISILASFFARRTRRVLWSSGLLLVIVALALFLVLHVDPRLWPISLVLFGSWILLITWARRTTGEDLREQLGENLGEDNV